MNLLLKAVIAELLVCNLEFATVKARRGLGDNFASIFFCLNKLRLYPEIERMLISRGIARGARQ